MVILVQRPSLTGVGLQGELEAHSPLNGEVMIWSDLTRDRERLSEPDSRNIMQNQIRSGGALFDIRKAFIASPGHKMLVADYDQLEMYLTGHASGAPGLVQAAWDGKDIHTANVEMVYNEPYDEVMEAKKSKNKDKRQLYLCDLRQAIKSIGFGQLNSQAEEKPSFQRGNLSAAA